MATAARPLDTRADLTVPAALRRAHRRILALRVVFGVLAVLLIAYVGVCFKYAETLTRVPANTLDRPASYVAAKYEDVSFRTADGLTLRGWWFPAVQPRDRAVVLVHGKDQNRIDSSFPTGRIARLLLDRGYSALLFDLRAHGESEGLRWGLGKQEALDVAAAVDLAAQKANIPRSRVAVIAESMGAGSASVALAHVPDVGPMVLDSVYTSATTVIDEIGPSISGLPSWFTPGMVLMARLFFSLDVDAVRPIERVRAHPDRAFLLIHCTDDTTVALHHGREMKAASANPRTELWVAPDCGHVKSFSRYPAEWEARVVAFLERELAR